MCGTRLIDENGDELKKMFQTDKTEIYSGKEMVKKLLVWDGCDSATWDKLFERSLWEGLKFIDVVCDDLEVTIMLLGKAECVTHIPGAKYYYRQRKGSVTKKSFSNSKFDLYYEAEKIRKMIYTKYPEFVREANFFVWHYLCSLISQAYEYKPIYREQYRKLQEIFWEHHPKLIIDKRNIKNNIKIIIKLILLIKVR